MTLWVRNLPPEQEAIRAKCFHPGGSFVEFKSEEVEQSIPERFGKIVRRYPERIAVKAEDQAVTYAGLNAMVNHVAHAIWEQRGSAAEPIGLLLEQGVGLVAAMLGVLTAGKFFVLLDPSFPKARIITIVQDSRCALIVADRNNASLASDAATGRCRVMEIESTDSAIGEQDLNLSVPPEAVASILYTSGSTGEPKGVISDHRDLLHRIMLRTNENCACEEDRIAVLSSGTGNAITSAFLAVLNGACLLPFNVRRAGVARLGTWLRDEKISICALSSPLFRKLCDTLVGNEEFPDLRVLRLRSEAVYKSDFDLYKKCFPPRCVFVTGISSSEAGQLTTYLADHHTEIASNEVPVGYPLKDKEVLLVDDDGRELGFNQLGEIAVKSRFLSAGYWGRPELTQRKFKADPQGGDKRLYFTGDLGVMLPDGCLVYKGRKDLRLKVRGFGVEIAEIEKCLLNHPAVREGVVVARRDDLQEACLIAYVTFNGQRAPGVNELRNFLREKLPDYMIPTTVVALETMPLRANGKVDRDALPVTDHRRPDLDTAYVAAETSLEKKLAKIWTEVLRLDQVGVHDNFFDLGGHSLLATRVIARVYEMFQVELTPNDFFAAPTVASLAGYVERANLPRANAGDTGIPSAARKEPLPLSFGQRRLWYLNQLAPESAAYNLASAYRLTGRLDATVLENSFNEIISRHEILRTVFEEVAGEPYQTVLPSLAIKVPLVDLRESDSDVARDLEVERRFTAEAKRPFDLVRGPLLRAILLRLTEEEHVLIETRHHIVYDGWSRGIIARELSALYAAFSQGKPSPLEELPIQYGDFAQWQLNALKGERLVKQLAYWKNQLQDLPPLLLPTDRPRPAFQGSHGGRHYFAFSRALSGALKRIAHEREATLFMTLLAAYQTLLSRYTGQDDIAIGSPIAGRQRTEFEGLIGLFLNMLILRGDLSGNPTFIELLSRTRAVCLAAYAHQEVPFEKLVEELHPQRDLSRNPLFQVTFGLQNTQQFQRELPDVEINTLNISPATARFDLELFIEEEGGALEGYANYNSDLFDADTIARIMGHFQTLLEGIVANPNQRISDLPILTGVERQQLLVEWNHTGVNYPGSKCIHELFEEQVARTPDAVAVVYEEEKLTYGELNARANRLARYLTRQGVAPEVLVALCTERSLAMVVGLLGILKAGAAYVPLDPEYPKERLAMMVEEAQVGLILTQERFIEAVPETGLKVTCLDRDWEEIAKERDENVESQATAGNLAYVIYTSGSTGRPKGVMNSQGSICNRLLWMQEEYKLTPNDRVLQKTPLSFDVSVWELFWPLTTGACLIVARPRGHLDPGYLVQVISEQRISVLHFVPSMLQVFLDYPGVEQCHSVRQVICSGERLSYQLQTRFFERLRAGLANLYGPTEAAVDVTSWSCADKGVSFVVPIGRPIANTQIYILDMKLQPVPIGIAGVLHIGGMQVARGYLHQSDLTAENFVPDPFAQKPGARLYRTGDLARYLPDGNIEFLGRSDYQLKIRGYRIELGEIESVLRQHPEVREVVVVAEETAPDDKRLIAYVVASQDSAPSADALRRFIKQKLPDYMVPSAFVFLDCLPLTPNGKVDRRALPAPGQSRAEQTNPFVAPRTPGEESLAGIWAEVLKLEKLGIYDNFFDLGGHSLLATQIISRVRQSFGIDIALRALFETPTVAGMIEHIETLLWAGQKYQPAPRGKMEEREQITL